MWNSGTLEQDLDRIVPAFLSSSSAFETPIHLSGCIHGAAVPFDEASDQPDTQKIRPRNREIPGPYFGDGRSPRVLSRYTPFGAPRFAGWVLPDATLPRSGGCFGLMAGPFAAVSSRNFE
jgi:hypothetical protein